MLKRLEVWGKLLLALVAAAVLFRPRRRARALSRIASARRVLLVRIDERVGEALLTTPLFDALKRLPQPPEVHLAVHRRVARVLNGHPSVDALHPLDRSDRIWAPFSPAIRALRRLRFDAVVNCASWDAPSVGPAIVARLAAPHAALVGPDVWPVRLLHDLPVPALPGVRSEVRQRLHLLAPFGIDESRPELSFRPVADDATVTRAVAALGGRPFAVVNPGGRLGERRVPPEVFAAAARAIGEMGWASLVTWGPGEEELARACAAAAPGAILAPPTSIDQLAALMRRARATVCNNTGPMHLSVAVGTPTLAFFHRMEIARWGHPAPPHRMVDLTRSPDPARDAAAAARELAASLTAALDLSRESP